MLKDIGIIALNNIQNINHYLLNSYINNINMNNLYNSNQYYPFNNTMNKQYELL